MKLFGGYNNCNNIFKLLQLLQRLYVASESFLNILVEEVKASRNNSGEDCGKNHQTTELLKTIETLPKDIIDNQVIKIETDILEDFHKRSSLSRNLTQLHSTDKQELGCERNLPVSSLMNRFNHQQQVLQSDRQLDELNGQNGSKSNLETETQSAAFWENYWKKPTLVNSEDEHSANVNRGCESSWIQNNLFRVNDYQ